MGANSPNLRRKANRLLQTVSLYGYRYSKTDILNGDIHFAAGHQNISVGAHGLSIKASGQSRTLSADLEVSFDSLSLGLKNGPINLYELLFQQECMK